MQTAIKRCHKCMLEKSHSDFSKSNQTRDGLQGACKTCRNGYYVNAIDKYKSAHIERYAQNKTEIKKRTRDYYHNNPEPRKLAARTRYALLLIEVKQLVKRKAAERDRLFPALAAVRVARRRAKLRNATPKWLSDDHKKEILNFYITADGLNMLLGIWHQVDHIVPLNGKTVCGLHTPWNLQVLPASENASKNNRYWPGKP